MTNQEKYNARLKRVEDALAVKEPDQVPCIPFAQTFPYLNNGYTMAEVMYDSKKAQESMKKYILDFEPDMATNYGAVFAGQGPMLEKLGINWLQWAGRPGAKIDENSIHQYLEEAYLADDEYPELLSDLSGWVLNKWLPRCFTSMESFKGINIPSMLSYMAITGTMQFANPAVVETVQTLHEVGKMAIEYFKDMAMFDKEIIELGFPMQMAGMTTAAFDILSDTLRGTIETMVDLYDQPENLKRAVETFYPSSLYPALGQSENSPGKFIFIPLHKGLDGFMGPEQYNEFYWPTLKRLVEDLIKAGRTPWIYTEGKYDSRLETIAEVTAGKCMFHFEDVDMKEAKRIVGKNHCISGGFDPRILEKGKPEEVREAVKCLLDVVAVDGGYVFDLNTTLDAVDPANVEAMFDAVKRYGKY